MDSETRLNADLKVSVIYLYVQVYFHFNECSDTIR